MTSEEIVTLKVGSRISLEDFIQSVLILFAILMSGASFADAHLAFEGRMSAEGFFDEIS